jgi:hypothetical protein
MNFQGIGHDCDGSRAPASEASAGPGRPNFPETFPREPANGGQACESTAAEYRFRAVKKTFSWHSQAHFFLEGQILGLGVVARGTYQVAGDCVYAKAWRDFISTNFLGS